MNADERRSKRISSSAFMTAFIAARIDFTISDRHLVEEDGSMGSSGLESYTCPRVSGF